VNPASAPATDSPSTDAPQRIIPVRRDYNRWVSSDTLEDHALRYTPQRTRRMSGWQVANTAFGASSFLILEAIGATLLLAYGFVNAALAIVCTGLIIFLAGLPISVTAARHGVDMDLLTRGAGFGYLGSTLTSLIYAAFTFIFFALEAAVMAYALELALGIPPVWGYLICALVVIPLVTHGVSVISRFQLWTQGLWLGLMALAFVGVWWHEPGAFAELLRYGGASGAHTGFEWLHFGAALTVGVALITQMGEQADYLRFMPPPQPGRAWRWWGAVVMGGPGWVIPGVLKMLGGALLCVLVLGYQLPPERATDPNQMYLAAFETWLPYGAAVALTALFVVVSQLKINVTNAYAGSLAWSNFFSRLTHSHPGRVVWVVFNTLIAFMLMEMNVFRAMGEVLGLFSNIAIAWMMAVVADLVINKPLGLSPKGIEFRRAYLYDINPVGVGAMGLASALSITAHLGVLGPWPQAFSAVLAMVTALIASPTIAWLTKGRYYLARQPEDTQTEQCGADCPSCKAASGSPARTPRIGLSPSAGVAPRPGGDAAGGAVGVCIVCQREYESPDMAHCPAYQGPICSLCCTLDARCDDLCKPHGRFESQWLAVLQRVLPTAWQPSLQAGLAHYLLIMAVAAPVLAAVLALLLRQGATAVPGVAEVLQASFVRVYAVLLLMAAVVAWWLVLNRQGRRVAQQESQRQTQLLMQEIDSHRRTDAQLQQARAAADAANQAKTRYISAVSHELRTPLNSILGYAQLLQADADMPAHRAQAVRVIQRGGEHLLSLIDGTLDVARIESGKLALDVKPMALARTLSEVASLFELQAAAKGLQFSFEVLGQPVPAAVRADDKRLRQILINLLGNAVKFTDAGSVGLRVRYARQMATFEVHDTGPGMSTDELDQVFEPFARARSADGVSADGRPLPGHSGSGLGLTIARMLTDVMGGEMTVHSTPGQGTVFTVRLFLPQVADLPTSAMQAIATSGYDGPRRTIWVVDNEAADRQLLRHWLEPLGFVVHTVDRGDEALAQLDALAPGASGSPDALCLDLAMPGIDGWETLRRLRVGVWAQLPVLIVSANAFDRGLDNAVSHPASDFLVKPVRRDDLLLWLGQRLQLPWRTEATKAPPASATGHAPAAPAAPQWSDADADALHALLRLGYPRGVLQWLEAWALRRPEHAALAQAWSALAREFRFEAIATALDARRAAPPPDPPAASP
jgi:signal transduction histidine kinase/CheY-like chemotaxis protein/purine-cytosine permease-like protein